MAASRFKTTQLQHFSEDFVESVGSVIFRLSPQEICLIQNRNNGEWLLPKGRRNCGESRKQTALREAQEETGYSCHLLPITLNTRAPPSIEVEIYPDEPRLYHGIVEPFALTTRQLGERNTKLIWWYIAALDETEQKSNVVHPGDESYTATFFPYAAAAEKLTYETDKAVVQKAVEIVLATFDSKAT